MNKKYYYDENFFTNINSEAKAYFLGFLYADGYVNDKLGYVELTLKYDDYKILKTFLEQLKSNRKVLIVQKKTGKYGRIIINSRKIVSDLIQLGCTNHKTHTLKFPETLDKNLIHHMIRGYFDGDGCIWCDKQNHYHIQFDGNLDFIIGVENFFIKKLNVIKKENFGKRHRNRNDNIIVLRYGGNNIVSTIYGLLYHDATYFLERKQNKFLLAINEKINHSTIEYSGVTYMKYNISKLYDIIEMKTGLNRKKIRSRFNTGWNVYDIFMYGKKDKNKKNILKLDLQQVLIEKYVSLEEAARQNECNADTISRNAKKNKKYKNFYWRFE